MNLDDHKDYFLEEDEPAAEVTQGDVIDFTPGKPAVPQTGESAPKKKRKGRRFLAWLITIAVLVLAGIFYVRYFNPYAVEARTTGYITEFEKRGILFKTFEGTMATESALADSSKIYDRNFTFTVPDEVLARKIQNLSTGTPRRLTLVYEKYYGMLPWRGGSTNVVTAVLED
ncbi:MAG: hypothetical protein K2H84_03510 [Paramuribaculum sp.]|nr:hypothetical protein [Paramuribaculum sp.]